MCRKAVFACNPLPTNRKMTQPSWLACCIRRRTSRQAYSCVRRLASEAPRWEVHGIFRHPEDASSCSGGHSLDERIRLYPSRRSCCARSTSAIVWTQSHVLLPLSGLGKDSLLTIRAHCQDRIQFSTAYSPTSLYPLSPLSLPGSSSAQTEAVHSRKCIDFSWTRSRPPQLALRR